jgi:hypothetical protein
MLLLLFCAYLPGVSNEVVLLGYAAMKLKLLNHGDVEIAERAYNASTVM